MHLNNDRSSPRTSPLAPPSAPFSTTDADPATAHLQPHQGGTGRRRVQIEGDIAHRGRFRLRGPLLVPIRVQSTDATGLSIAMDFTIVVDDVNDFVLGGVPARANNSELVPYRFTATAADIDLSANTSVFSLMGAGSGSPHRPEHGGIHLDAQRGPGAQLLTNKGSVMCMYLVQFHVYARQGPARGRPRSTTQARRVGNASSRTRRSGSQPEVDPAAAQEQHPDEEEALDQRAPTRGWAPWVRVS